MAAQLIGLKGYSQWASYIISPKGDTLNCVDKQDKTYIGTIESVDVNDHIFGTKGRVDVMKHIAYDLSGKQIWRHTSPKSNHKR